MILDLLFKLIKTFVLIDPAEFAKMKEEAFAWWDSIRFDKNAKKNWKWYLRYYSEQWYIKLAMTILFIPAVKWIREWMQPAEYQSEEAREYGE